jgi:hypothetical protein
MAKKSYWIKQRMNPQLGKIYYVACGQLTVKEAKARTETLYGSNVMIRYKTEVEYKAALDAMGISE